MAAASDAKSAVVEVGTAEAWAENWVAQPPGTLVVVDFWASWAEPCKQMDALFAQLAGVHAKELPHCWRVSAEDVAVAAETLSVQAVPAFVCVRVKEGKRAFDVVEPRVDGADPAALAKAFGAWAAAGAEAAAAAASEAEKLQARLKQLTSNAPVQLFMKGDRTTPQCGFSRKIVELLNETGVEYSTFDILQDNDVRQGLKTFSDWPTFPQLYAAGEFLGGLDVVRDMHTEGDLVPTLKDAVAKKGN